jgi:glc operon protein GlcG
MRTTSIAIAAAALLAGALPARAQVVTASPGLGLEGARHVIAAAAAEARRHRAGGAIAVVDAGGALVALERLDGTFPAAAAIAVGKARTAAIFRKPTRDFEEIIRGGRTPMLALPDFTPLQGGVPIVIDGHTVGAVGVSGAASAAQDDELAMAGAAAAGAAARRGALPAMPVTHLDGARVAAAFARGMPLLEVDGYKIHASRRDAPGLAEVHDVETDVIYVVDGSATLVTGGALDDGTVTEPGQVRGPRIRGGVSRRLARGDVVVVPPGTPHQFTEVQAPFLYFVVKPIAAPGVGR